jgi:hypothetical protein
MSANEGTRNRKAGESQEISDANATRIRKAAKKCDAREDEAPQDSTQCNSFSHPNQMPLFKLIAQFLLLEYCRRFFGVGFAQEG